MTYDQLVGIIRLLEGRVALTATSWVVGRSTAMLAGRLWVLASEQVCCGHGDGFDALLCRFSIVPSRGPGDFGGRPFALG